LAKTVRFTGLVTGLVIICFMLAGTAGLVGAPGLPAFASAENNRPEYGQVVLVIIDRITLDDLLEADAPALKNMALNGVLGLMTTSPAAGYPRVPENTYTTIGAGARVQGGSSAVLGFNSLEKYENDTALDAYFRRMGINAGEAEVVHLGIAEMERANAGLKYEFTLGAIGTALHQYGFTTAVIGNADIPGAVPADKKTYRQAVAIAMDKHGKVDFGDVSARTYKFDPQSLAGVRTDYAALMSKFLSLRAQADFVVLETGDTSRIDKMGYISGNDVLRENRRKALAEIDDFLGQLLEQIDLNKDLLMIVAPEPPTEAMERGNFLTPFVMAGRGVSKGVAWSGTTKRHGLITNIDIAPEVLGYFGLPALIEKGDARNNVLLAGQVIESRKSRNPVEVIKKLNEDTVFLYNARYPLVKGYINGALAVIILGILAVIFDKPAGKYMKPALVVLTVIPGVMLWANYLPHPSIGVLGLEIAVIVVSVTALFTFLGRKKPLNPFIFSSGLTVLMIAGDLLAGAPLARTSPFSYDAMIGARFYGIGNEFMGVFIGSTIVFAGLSFDSFKGITKADKTVKTAAILLFLAVTYVIAAPNLGANVGGTIAAVAGFGVSALTLGGAEINKKTVLAVSAMIMIVLAGFVAYDLSRAVEVQSHLGRTISLIREHGISEVAGIISRKWAVNFKLIKKTTWSWFYFTSLLAILYLGRMLPKKLAMFRHGYPWFNKLLTGIIFGSVFALVFNDSGIVAAATMITYAVAPFLTWLIPVQRRVGK